MLPILKLKGWAGVVSLALTSMAVVATVLAPADASRERVARRKQSLQRTVATVVADVERKKVGFCKGEGGEYYKVDLQIRGPIVSNDQRLSGEFVGHVRVLAKRTPIDQHALIGHGRDDFIVVNEEGQEKARGTGFFVFDHFKPLKGLLFVTLRDGSTWISNFSVVNELIRVPIILDAELRRAGQRQIDIRGPIVVEMGGQAAPNPTDPGVVQTGSCPGGFDPNPLRNYAPQWPRVGR